MGFYTGYGREPDTSDWHTLEQLLVCRSYEEFKLKSAIICPNGLRLEYATAVYMFRVLDDYPDFVSTLIRLVKESDAMTEFLYRPSYYMDFYMYADAHADVESVKYKYMHFPVLEYAHMFNDDMKTLYAVICDRLISMYGPVPSVENFKKTYLK